MTTIITQHYEQWCANQIISGQPARPDTVVFAHIPDQDDNADIPRNETLPEAACIQYQMPVTQYGLIAPNAVAFSVILDTTIGDFDYNWIGLLHAPSQTLCMIAHTPLQQKIKTADGVQGNNLTRTFVMEFDGAAAAMQVDVVADVWQIDFTARLAGMDETRRLMAQDYYGETAFFGEGFRVSYQDRQATIAAGVGYVHGLRVQLDTPCTLSAASGDTLWIDACWQGLVTGAWHTAFTFTASARPLTTYIDEAGFTHYLAPLAHIAADSTQDLRPATPDEQQHNALAEHEKSRNHPDASLTEKGFAQYSNATDSDAEDRAATPKAVKTACELANAANQNANTRLQKNQNGADIPDKPRFVDNLGLRDTVNEAAGALQKNQNGADIPDKNRFVRNINVFTQTESDARYLKTADNLPVGIPLPWPLATPPAGWLVCHGQAFNKAQFPQLAKAYPNGVLPDLRGLFIRGWDNGRNLDGGRALLSFQGDASRRVTGSFSVYGAKELSDFYPSASSGAFTITGVQGKNNVAAHGVTTIPQFNFDTAKVVPSANENRPVNMAFNYIVRAA
ncbi:phage tail protein [Yersinia enterocolitica]